MLLVSSNTIKMVTFKLLIILCSQVVTVNIERKTAKELLILRFMCTLSLSLSLSLSAFWYTCPIAKSIWYI